MQWELSSEMAAREPSTILRSNLSSKPQAEGNKTFGLSRQIPEGQRKWPSSQLSPAVIHLEKMLGATSAAKEKTPLKKLSVLGSV